MMDGKVRVYVRGEQRAAAADMETESTAADRDNGNVVAAADTEAVTVTETRTEGLCRIVNGARHFLYEENISEDGGEDGAIRTHTVVREGQIEVHRRGSVETDFVFREGTETETLYKTPWLQIPMRIRTRKLAVSGSGTLHIHLEYELFAGGEMTGSSVVEMEFAAQQGEESKGQ